MKRIRSTRKPARALILLCVALFSKYAKIFMLANSAADFSIANGFTPPRCVVKYPAEESIMTDISVPVNSFYWPFPTVSTGQIRFIGVGLILDFLGHTGELTQHAVYITGSVAQPNWRSTLFHEYGHFIMDASRGWNWPVSLAEYVGGDVPFEHHWSDGDQNDRLAFLEGWANFYGTAVESWLYNPSSPYSGRFVSDGQVWPDIFESSSHTWPPPTDGYRHELYIGRALFDFYDSENGGDADGFQTSFQNILTVIGERHSVMPEYMSVLSHKPFLTDQQRNAGIGIMNSLIMDPLASYGNSTMYITNDFRAGVVNIDNSDIHTENYPNGIVTQTQLWMSNKRLEAKEQMFGGYQRLFRHTNQISQGFDWTTQNPTKGNLTAIWNTYTEPLTFTANFDRLCNVTVNFQVYDGGQFPSVTTNHRAGSSASIYVPSQIVNGTTYVFSKWTDGSTDNPRVELVNSHVVFTAVMKGHLVASSVTATAPGNQRKTTTCGGTTHTVYTSSGSIWYIRDAGNGWSNEVLVSSLANLTAKNPSITTSLEGVLILNVVWEETINYGLLGNKQIVKYSRSTDYGVTWCSPIFVNDLSSSSGVDALPVIASSIGRVAVVWEVYSPTGLLVKIDPFYNSAVISSVPATDATSHDASLSGGSGALKLVYKQDNGRIMYREFFPNADYTVTYNDQTLRDISSPQASASKPSVSSTVDQRVFVSWEADVTGGGHHVFVTERDPSSGWKPAVEFAYGTNTEANSCVYVSEGSGQVYVTWDLPSIGHIAVTSRALTSSTWRPVHDLGAGYSFSSPAWAGSADGATKSIYVTGAAAPFTINTYILLPPPSIVSTVLNGWNMTGIPLVVYDFAKAAVYPTATSSAFAYNNGYVATDPLSNVRGWYIKFDSAQSIRYEGDWISYMPMIANNGWNIIGSISTPIATANVYTDPPNSLGSPFYRYQNGYVITDTLRPGGGYWVKTNAAGYIILDASMQQQQGQEQLVLGSYDKFTLRDATGGTQELYVRNGTIVGTSENVEMPPLAPDSLFDVRFTSGEMVKTVFPDSGITTLSIALNEVVYPVQVSWDIRPENGITYAMLPDSSGGLGKGAQGVNLREAKGLVISNRGSGVLHLVVGSTNKAEAKLPKQYDLHQNYPNPFNPATEIRFDLPEAGNVSLVVYDMLGREVATLASGYREAGYHSTAWNANRQASGVYFARFNVTRENGKSLYSKINKLTLLR